MLIRAANRRSVRGGRYRSQSRRVRAIEGSADGEGGGELGVVGAGA